MAMELNADCPCACHRVTMGDRSFLAHVCEAKAAAPAALAAATGVGVSQGHCRHVLGHSARRKP